MIKFFKKNTKSKAVEVKFFDSIENLPHRRMMKFNKEVMRQNEVGNSAVDVKKRIERAMSFLSNGYTEKAFKELSNALLAFNYAQAEIHPKGLALAVMVDTINGQKQNDLTSEGLKNVLSILQDLGIKGKSIDNIVDTIKKKSKQS